MREGTRTIAAALGLAVLLPVGMALGWALKPAECETGQASIVVPGYRYVEELAIYTQPARPKSTPPTEPVRWEQRSERWVLPSLADGYWIGQPGRVLRGDPRAIAGDLAGGRGYYAVAISMRPRVRKLPTDATALRRLLLAAIADRRWDESGAWAEGQPTPARLEYGFVEVVVALLADADVTPAQRRALFGALKLSPGAHAIPGSDDAVRVPLDYPEPQHGAYTVIFDSDRAELRSWSVDDGRSTETHFLLRSGHVDWIGQRP